MYIFLFMYRERLKICQTIQSTGKLQLSENKVFKIINIINSFLVYIQFFKYFLGV